MTERHVVLQRILDLYERPRYLEIGVNTGATFDNIAAAKKVAVDPNFLCATDVPDAMTGRVEYHDMTSDDYFAGCIAGRDIFEVIYLDGLHTFEQTLRDLLNAVTLLAPGGVIVVDDVLPNSFDASLPDLDQVFALRSKAAALSILWATDGSWMGDVFKIPFFVQTFMQAYSYATVAENHGQVVIWQQMRSASQVGKWTVESVSRMDFRTTILERDSMKILPLDQIIDLLRRARSTQVP